MSQFRFAAPQWGQLFWLLLLLAILMVWLEFRGRSALDRFISTMMQPRLVQSPSRARRLLSLACLLSGLAALILASMQPQWGATERRLPRSGAQIMICLDVSKSMLAEDTVPNRLERAKAEIGDLLNLMRGEQAGLIGFAGKATVISPLTTDFGFLKLMLDNLNIYSVGRGGTRLEEPIRKAIEGFGEAADISRVILLITDGEDHDSFPIEAATAAREAGIKIITIGFGDEAGSKIEITNPRTGAREFLKDRDGNAVLSRLDGATLRDIALKTDGAYIPAGTGALDLESIHRQHIAPLVRGRLDNNTQIIRNEAFQWAVLAGMMLLGMSVVIARGLPTTQFADGDWTPALSRAAIFILAGWLVCPSLLAQDPDPVIYSTQQTGPGESDESDAGRTSTTGDLPTAPSEQGREEPVGRDAYNQALARWTSDDDAAESLFLQARSTAGTDGEVRYRAAYNLGWVEVQRADRLLKEDPKLALVHLRSAADWFRQAVRLRPKDQDARHNLEIVLRRALELADSLASKDAGDVARRLDELIQAQRAFVGETGELVERLASEKPATSEEAIRRDFRNLATQERQILSDSQSLAESIADQLAAVAGKSTPPQQGSGSTGDQDQEEAMRAAQLSAASHYLQQAIQRMGQSRSQLRRKEDQRAFRRAAAGLSDLKRARDMMRPPHEILKRLATDTRTLMNETGRKSRASTSLSGADQVPSWLTDQYVRESQASLTDRTNEWASGMAAASGDDQPAGPAKPGDEAKSRQQREQLEAIELVQQAADDFAAAQQSLETGNFSSALDHQTDAAIALSDALERYLDVKGLIEATHATEQRIENAIDNLGELPDTDRARLMSSLADLQRKNLERSRRLEDRLDLEEMSLDQELRPPTEASGADESAEADPGHQEQMEQQREQLAMARQLLQEADQQMKATEELLQGTPDENPEEVEPGGEDPETPRDDPDSSKAPEDDPDQASSDGSPAPDDKLRQAAHEATERLQDLRRLFYSVTEHLQETAQRQADINDRTEEMKAEPDPARQQRSLGPLRQEQQQLEQLARKIADALQEQADAARQKAPQQGLRQSPDPTSEDPQKQQADQFQQAAKLVTQAREKMQHSSDQMEQQPPQLEALRTSQDESLERLIEALQLLVPPQSQQEQQQDQQQDPSQDQNQDQENKEPKEPQDNMSMQQLLQMIRDRDAQRRRDRERKRSIGNVPVDKDW